MIGKLFFALVAVAATVDAWAIDTNRNKCWTDGNGESAKWFDSGVEIVRGRYWYECREGNLEPLGCINDSGDRVMKNDAYVSEGFQYRCVMDTEGYLFFEPAACVTSDGVVHQPGDTFDLPSGHNYWQKCTREYLYNRPYLSVTTEGCLVGESRRRIALNETYDDDDTQSWWECRNQWSSAQLCLKGCLKDGKRVVAGEEWEDGEYVYTCAKKGDRAEIECVGCMDERSKRVLRSGDRYWSPKDSVMQCEILYDSSTGATSKEHKVVGCVERDRRGQAVGERTLGCRWYDVDGNVKYEHQCSREGRALPSGCTLQRNGFDYLFVPPNMYTIHHPSGEEPIYMACRTRPDNTLEHFLFTQQELEDGGRGRLRGLKYTIPRGK